MIGRTLVPFRLNTLRPLHIKMIGFTHVLSLTTMHAAAKLTCTKITSTTPTAHKTCTTARLMHDHNKEEACLRPNRLYRYKSRGFPAVRTSTPVSVILKTDQSRWGCSGYVPHLQQRFFKLSTSLPIYGRRCPVIGPMNFIPITPKIYHLQRHVRLYPCLL
jgi:hypothetical protein